MQTTVCFSDLSHVNICRRSNRMAYLLVFTKPQSAIVVGLYKILPTPTAIYFPLTQNHTTTYLLLTVLTAIRCTENDRRHSKIRINHGKNIG
jgi:hypothetical protein